MIHIYFCASLLLCPSEIFSDFSHISLSFLFGILTFSFTTFENDFFFPNILLNWLMWMKTNDLYILAVISAPLLKFSYCFMVNLLGFSR